MLSTLVEAIPDRPSKPVPLATAPSPVVTNLAHSSEPELSSSAGTEDSDGPETPAEGDLLSESSQPRTRSTSGKDRRPPAAPLSLGRALLPILPYLKQYSLFISHFSSSLSRLSDLETSLDAPLGTSPGSSSLEDRTKWQAFVGEVRKKEGKGRKLGLGGMLLSVVQRVPRYRLMLEDLIRFTERDHSDLKDLKMAFEIVDDGKCFSLFAW